MKKKAVERTLVVLLACAACVGVTSCGNDSAEQSAPQEPAAQTPAQPAQTSPAPQAQTPLTPAQPAQTSPAPAPQAQTPPPSTPPAQTLPPPAPASQEQTAPSTQPSTEPAAAVAPAASVTASHADVFAELERLGRLAKQSKADYVASARAWAGNIFERKLWVCAIAQKNNLPQNDLAALARDARAACSGADATFGHFYAIAKYFKACGSFNDAREALTQARKLVDTAKQLDDVADLLRSMQ